MPIGSMGRLYIYVDFDGFHVGKYNSPMDCLGKESKVKNNVQPPHSCT